jgi:hypothetical protein
MGRKRSGWLIAIGSVVGVLYVLAGVLLWTGWAKLHRSGVALVSTKGVLDRHYRRDPFPSESNVQAERKNVAELDASYDQLLGKLREGQVESTEQSPPRVLSRYLESRQALLERAKSLGISRPDDYDFGFHEMGRGDVPTAEDKTTMPRLSEQIEIVNEIATVLLDAKITELRGVGREQFEKPKDAGAGAAATGGSGGGGFRSRSRAAAGPAGVNLNTENPAAGLVSDGALFGAWHFGLDFTAKEAALLDVLNRLARHRLFVVVTRLEVVGEDQSAMAALRRGARENPKAGAAGANEEEVLPRELRIVYGQETPLSVRLDVDVYRFPKAAAAAPRQGAG